MTTSPSEYTASNGVSLGTPSGSQHACRAGLGRLPGPLCDARLHSPHEGDAFLTLVNTDEVVDVFSLIEVELA